MPRLLTPLSIVRTRCSALLWMPLFFVVLVSSGCSARRRPTFVWSAAVRVKPIIPEHSAAGAEDVEEPALDWKLEIPPPLPRGGRSGPVKPRVAAGPQGGNSSDDGGGPLISPQLTDGQIAAAKLETRQSLGVAEHNLAVARGRSLNPAQADLASKVRGFLDDARQAGHSGDWTHAQAVAKKAEVLSDELVNSL